jgi:HEAT repeat protein
MRLTEKQVKDWADKKKIKKLILVLRKIPSDNLAKLAIGALVEAGEEAVRPLVKKLKDSDIVFRVSVENALGRIGDPDSFQETGSIAEALGNFKDECVVKELMDAYHRSGKYAVQGSIITALGNIGSATAAPLIMEAMHHRESFVRKSAALAMGSLPAEVALDQLAKAFISEEDWEAKKEMARSMAKLRWKASPDRLGAEYCFINERWDEMVEIGEPAAEYILGYLNCDPSMCVPKMGVLIKMKEKSVPAIIAIIEKESEWSPRLKNCLMVLWNIKSERTVKPLINLLHHKDSSIRAMAVDCLKVIGTQEALDAAKGLMGTF